MTEPADREASFTTARAVPRIPRPRPPTLLTEDEWAALDLTVALANLVPRIVGNGLTRASDQDEIVRHIHGIQQAILSQVPARAYPRTFRLLGEVLEDPS